MSRSYFFQHIQNEINFANRIKGLDMALVSINTLKSIHESIKQNILINRDEVKITSPNSLRVILQDVQLYTALLFIIKDGEISLQDIIDFKESALELFKRKNADYGDAFALYGIPGVLMRMGDKFQRIFSLSDSNNVNIKSESQADTIIDLYNYSIMAIMLIDEHKEVIDLSDRNTAMLTINKYANDLQKLNEIREYIIEKTHPLSCDVHKNKSLLEIVNNLISSRCEHKWVRDYGEYVDSHTPHYCEKCGISD